MIRAIRRKVSPKTVTRRIIMPQPKHMLVEGLAHVTIGMNPAEDGLNWYDADGINPGRLVRCPYGATGDVLWVRESYRFGAEWDDTKPSGVPPVAFSEDDPHTGIVYYEADGLMARPEDNGWGELRPGMFMPRWASRLKLEIVSRWPERLHHITEADAIAEGVETHAQKYGLPESKLHGTTPWYRYDDKPYAAVSAVESYRTLWESINGAGSWAANPHVWRIEFRDISKEAAT